VLEDHSDGIELKLLKRIKIALQELILALLAVNLRAEFEDKSVNEVYSILRARFASSDVAAYTTSGVKLCLLRQAPEQSILNYIAKWDGQKAQYEASGGELGPRMQMGIFVAGLQPQYSKEAFIKAVRQGNGDPDFEGLKQALIRVSIFDKNQREFRRPNAPKPAVRQNERNERNFSSEKGEKTAWAHCGNIRHSINDCWFKYPEKRPSQGQWRGKYRGSTEKEVIASQSTARSAVDACVLQENSWLLDSAVSFHITKSREALVDITPIEPQKVRVGNDNELDTKEKGSICLENRVELFDVYFVHDLDMDLLSVDALLMDNWTISFISGQQRRAILTKNKLSISILSKYGVFQVEQAELAKSTKNEGQKGTPKLSEQLIHQRLGHLNSEFVRLLPEASGRQFELKYEKKEFCEPYIFGKQRRRPNREPATSPKALRPSQRIHVNLCGGGSTFASKEAQIAENFDELPISEGGAKFFMVMSPQRFEKRVLNRAVSI